MAPIASHEFGQGQPVEFAGSDVPALLAQAGTVLLDTADGSGTEPRSVVFAAPVYEVVANRLEEVAGAIEEVERHVSDGLWAAGIVGYEAGYAFESQFSSCGAGQPLLWFGLYEKPWHLPADARATCMAALESGSMRIANPRAGIDQRDYVEKVEVIRGHIREGDIYQVNYTFPYCFDFEGDPRALFGRLRVAQPVSFAAYIETGSVTVLSLSPELFFERNGNRITTRPMKGTAPATSDPDVDDDVARKLRDDPKNRAENLMIVDLLRNDLARCCLPGSVVVRDLFTVERYPSVLQMTSTIEGTLGAATSYQKIFQALFPCGSVTGAPKIRAMDIIRDLEAGPRGIYCGAIGYISPNDAATFSVAIRTVTLKGTEAVMGTGSGIVWDSDPDAEFEECLLKTRFVKNAAIEA
ncbi:MAG: aminodeoxychorismate synthase component I [Rhodothermia bacterium]|nr:aminodeoxychorismate synthase component I [Rhodothermia bacterium]